MSGARSRARQLQGTSSGAWNDHSKCLPRKVRRMLVDRGPGPRRTSSPSSPPRCKSTDCSPERPSPSMEQPHRPQPSAPSPGLVLFNSEDQSDVVIMAGCEPRVWRFPGHSFILAAASPVFCNMLRGREAPVRSTGQCMKVLAITDVEPDVFQSVLRYVYTREVALSSVATSLSLLSAANKYMLGELSSECLLFLCQKVDRDNALEVMRRVRPMCRGPPSEWPEFLHEGDNLQNELLTKCLELVDAHAEKILNSDAFEDLDGTTLAELLARDTLDVSSEAAVFQAIMRWACQECKRRHLELVPENKKEVLGKTLYSVRYLAMSFDEFLRGPVSAGVLDDADREAILARLQGDHSVPCPPHLLLPGRRKGPGGSFLARCISTPDGNDPPPGRSYGRSLSSPAGDVNSESSVMEPLSSTSRGRVRRNSADRKKNTTAKTSAHKKLLHGLGDIVICVIQLLD